MGYTTGKIKITEAYSVSWWTRHDFYFTLLLTGAYGKTLVQICALGWYTPVVRQLSHIIIVSTKASNIEEERKLVQNTTTPSFFFLFQCYHKALDDDDNNNNN